MGAYDIDIFAALRTKRNRTNTANKAYVEFSASKVTFSANESDIAEGVANAIATAMRDNMLAGRAPDGAPLPPASPATVQRREYRDAQFGRTTEVYRVGRGKTKGRLRLDWQEQGIPGQRTPEQRRAKKRASRLKMRFRGMKVGTFDPRQFTNDRFGIESGMLANSLTVVQRSPNWHVYFADNRTRIDSKGGSAVSRVFSRIGLFSANGMRHPTIQRALFLTGRSLIVRRGQKIAAELARTFRLVKSIYSQTEQIAEANE